MVVWIGSAVTLIFAAVLGFGQSDNVQRILLIGAVALYILGVQAPTIAINIPLNNEIQAADTEILDGASQQEVRNKFEDRWNRSNRFRTIVSIVVVIILLLLLLLQPTSII